MDRRKSLLVAVALAPVAVVVACAEKPSLVAGGGECFLATDCQPGLVCVDQGNGLRTCTDDLSEVAGQPAPDGAMMGDTGEGGRDARQDNVTPDAPPDTNPPVDSGDES